MDRSAVERNLAVKPSAALSAKRHLIRGIVAMRPLTNPRIFGSVLHGNDKEGSDLDLLVDALPEATLFDLGGLQEDLQDLLGVRVDVRTPPELSARFRDTVLAEAEPV
jgi:predicted nucleotidyltransferase